MRPSPCRRFTILDAMILVAAVAGGLALARVGPQESLASRSSGLKVRVWLIVRGPLSIFMTMPTLAILPIRLRQPRPRWTRLMRQPGMVAACATAVTLLLGIASWTVYGTQVHQNWLQPEYVARFWRLHWHFIGPAVAGAWLALWLSGRWRPERGWIERTGRLLGAFWVASLLFARPLVPWTLSLDRLGRLLGVF